MLSCVWKTVAWGEVLIAWLRESRQKHWSIILWPFETEAFWGAFTRPLGPFVKKPTYLEALMNVKSSVQFLAEQLLRLSFRVWIYHPLLFSARTWPRKLKTIWKILMFSCRCTVCEPTRATVGNGSSTCRKLSLFFGLVVFLQIWFYFIGYS